MIERLYRVYIACLMVGTTVYMTACVVYKIIRALYRDYMRNR